MENTMKTKRAFTLVELLVVVAIIGILSSLVTVGVMSAVAAAKRSRIAMEMGQISLALEQYKNKFGEYPPDLYDKQAVIRHVKKRWPRFQFPTEIADLPGPIGAAPIDIQYWCLMKAVGNVYLRLAITSGALFMDDTSGSNVSTITRKASYIGSLPFWLGGFPNSDGKLAGFFADPEAPFGRDSTNKINNGNINLVAGDIQTSQQDKDNVFYEMIIDKNIQFVTTTSEGIVFPVLVNAIRSDLSVPYVYFRGNSSGGQLAYAYLDSTASSGTPSVTVSTYAAKTYDFGSVFSGSTLGLVLPYAKSGDPFVSSNSTPVVWQEPERFQLIHPGLDGIFCSNIADSGQVQLNTTTYFKTSYFRSINTNAAKNTIGQKDFDNITNFSDYQQIKAILP
jgi:prepilin-type N-terminal cleavage/methylation domain-containing protein